MPWLEVKVDPSDPQNETTFDECVKCFNNVSSNVSRDGTILDKAQLKSRITEVIDKNRQRPKLADNLTEDSEELMFRLYRFVEAATVETLLTIALDRTIYRELDEQNNPTGRPRRNNWCITLGIKEDNVSTDLDIASNVLELFHPSNGLIPASYQLALLWHSTKNNAALELQQDPKWDNLKHKSDMVFQLLKNHIEYPWHTSENAPREAAYAHWADHLGADQFIRFVPIKVV